MFWVWAPWLGLALLVVLLGGLIWIAGRNARGPS